eukprot:m.134058 g.134058  ORF g.134058 m.134058 type:complete len:381 (-) comp23852_c4_seq1:51-1193(-)
MTKETQEWLAVQCASTQGDLQQAFQTCSDLYDKKLWHQLTLKLLETIRQPNLVPSAILLELYPKLIKDIQDRINRLSLVQLLLLVGKQYEDPQELINFLEPVEDKVKESDDAVVCLKSAIASLYCQVGNFKKAEELLAECETFLDAAPGVSEMHSAYYKVAADYHQAQGHFAEFYTNGLRYLGCINFEDLDDQEQVQRAFDLGLAALLGDSIYNFGELLGHGLVEVLKNTEKQWLVDLLYAFNSGDVEKYEALKPQWAAQADLVANEESLKEKISLLALMEVVFRSAAKDRTLGFQVIADAAKIPLDQVEILVMRALSLGLVKGEIDEIEKVASLHWVQPRVLDLTQIGRLRDLLGDWCGTVQGLTQQLEASSSELVMAL